MTTTTTKKQTSQRKLVLHRDFSRVGKDFFALRDSWVRSNKCLSLDEMRDLRNEGQRG